MTTKTEDTKSPIVRGTVGDFQGLVFAENKTVTFKDWDSEREEEIAEMLQTNRKKLEGGMVCKYASLILQHMCISIGGIDFWNRNGDDYTEVITQPERELALSQMWEADVLISYFMLRNESMLDSKAEFSVLSPFDHDRERTCEWEGDLANIEIVGPATPEEARWEYKLRKPFKFRGDKITKLVFGPMRWQPNEAIGIEVPGAVNVKTIAASIHMVPEHLEGHVIQVHTSDLRRMHKADIRSIENEYNDHFAGLDMSIKVWDSVKKRHFDASIPWMSTDFFDPTSQ